MLGLLGTSTARAQQTEADQAWAQGRYDAARAGYLRVLASDPKDVRANLRIGVLLSWEGQLDSALGFIQRARAANPSDPEIRLVQARVLAWDKQYAAALAQYDSLLLQHPRNHDARVGRARTLAWAGKLDLALGEYRRLIVTDSTDREAILGLAQARAWSGDLASAEEEYRRLLRRNSRDVEARVGLGYVYLWQGREAAAQRQAGYALAIDPANKAGRELSRAARTGSRAFVEASANWSNDSDENTSFWQTLEVTVPVGRGIALLGAVNALETSDPLRDATRLGAEGGISARMGRIHLVGAGGVRRLNPEIAPSRTAATYRGRLSYRPIPRFGVSVSYSRQPFDEIASLMERELDLETFEGAFDFKGWPGLTLHGGAGGLWLSDGNSRTSFAGGINQKINRELFVGVFGRTLSYEERGIGYFSPDRFWVLEGIAGYARESRSWAASLSGGFGAQQVGERGEAQTEWHVEGRVGPRWGAGNKVELFGLITNSAVSSTTGAFRYRAAGLIATLGL